MLKRSAIKNIILVCIIIALIAAWQSSRPVQIMAAKDSVLFIKNIPVTDNGKIKWWNENKDFIIKKYQLIQDAKFFTIIIMDFGKGYQELPGTGWSSFDKSDQDFICFEEIKSKRRCIYKEWSFDITGSMSRKVFINIGDRSYVQTPDGKTELIDNQ